ncbi:MAG: hypothetical protein FWE89_05720, partial [Syntrophaceae bacterium]|nr:hypothetical protein [Syntrophaceae bacterium]
MKENTISFRPEFCGDLAATAGRELAAARFTHRIREKDHTLWKPEPTEIADRLGWLTSPWTMAGRLAEIEAVVNGVRDDGYEQVILLG